MQYDTAKELLLKCLELVTSGDAGRYVESPVVILSEDTKNGKYDFAPDDEYDILIEKAAELAELWEGHPRRQAGELLLAILDEITIPRDRLKHITGLLMEWYAWDKPEIRKRKVRTRSETLPALLASAAAPRKPADIRDAIAGRVVGQPQAAKAAAMIVYHHLAGRRSNSVFCGPSGCGKSEIWRALSKEYPGLIRIVDFSRISGEGWAGSMHLRDIFDGADKDALSRNGLIVVLDEADKIICERATGSGGTNHNLIVQNNLLKMLDGDVIEFGTENGKQEAFSVDCQNVSVVMLGAFETLLEKKAAGNISKPIGFGAVPEAEAGPPSHADISYDDLIKAGTRREIAGRINTITALDPLDTGRYKAILEGPVMSGLQESLGCTIGMEDAAASMLSEQAQASGLGVRWMKSAVFNAVSDAMFDAPDAAEYFVGLRDGKLYCRAEKWQPDEAIPDAPDFSLY